MNKKNIYIVSIYSLLYQIFIATSIIAGILEQFMNDI